MFSKFITTLLKGSIWRRHFQRRLVTQLQHMRDTATACLPHPVPEYTPDWTSPFHPFKWRLLWSLSRWMATSSYQKTVPYALFTVDIAHFLSLSIPAPPTGHHCQNMVTSSERKIAPSALFAVDIAYGSSDCGQSDMKDGECPVEQVSSLDEDLRLTRRLFPSPQKLANASEVRQRLRRSPTPLKIANTSEDRQHL